MKTHPQSLVLLAFTAAASLVAQTPAAKPATSGTTVHHAASASTALHAGGCVKTFEVSSKIPAAPATAACPKAMFTFTTRPGVNLDYVSPLVPKETREALGLDAKTFSLDYQELSVGTGELAQPDKFYTVQYTGWTPDGTQFDTSVGKPEPFVFPIGKHQVVAGWDLGLEGMHVGGKRRLFIPYELGYGERGNGHVPPKSDMVFDIELVSQSDKGPAPKTPPAPAMRPGTPGTPGTPGAPGTPARPVTPAVPVSPATPPAATAPKQ